MARKEYEYEVVWVGQPNNPRNNMWKGRGELVEMGYQKMVRHAKQKLAFACLLLRLCTCFQACTSAVGVVTVPPHNVVVAQRCRGAALVPCVTPYAPHALPRVLTFLACCPPALPPACLRPVPPGHRL